MSVRLSPRESRLMAVLKRRHNWVQSVDLCKREFGSMPGWPINARTIITGAVASIARKLHYHRTGMKILKRGGGRGGVEYKLEC